MQLIKKAEHEAFFSLFERAKMRHSRATMKLLCDFVAKTKFEGKDERREILRHMTVAARSLDMLRYDAVVKAAYSLVPQDPALIEMTLELGQGFASPAIGQQNPFHESLLSAIDEVENRDRFNLLSELVFMIDLPTEIEPTIKARLALAEVRVGSRPHGHSKTSSSPALNAGEMAAA